MVRRCAAQPFYIGRSPPFCEVHPMGLLTLDLAGTFKSLEIIDFLVFKKNMHVA